VLSRLRISGAAIGLDKRKDSLFLEILRCVRAPKAAPVVWPLGAVGVELGSIEKEISWRAGKRD